MNDSLVDKIISELNPEIKELISDYKGLYLFGSFAKGTSDEHSDYDFAIIVNNKINASQKEQIRRLIYYKMLKYDVIIDNPIIKYKDLINPNSYLKKRILDEGIFYEG